MNYKQLMELVGDNSEAVTFIQSMETNATTNVETINNLERSIVDIKSTRDDFKKGNTLVKSLLGLEHINEETIGDFLKSKNGKGDEAITAELENVKSLLANAENEKNGITSDYESKIQKMALDNEIAQSGVGASFANDSMYKLGLNLIKDGATYENGSIVYKNSDGTTAYNGSNPMGIKDKIESLKSDANYAGLFKPETNNGGGGTPPNQTPSSTPATQGMSSTEMMKAGRQ